MNYMPVVIDAEYLADYQIKVIFDNGEERVVNCFKWLKGELFEPLKDKGIF